MQGIYAVVGGLNLSNALRTAFKKKWKTDSGNEPKNTQRDRTVERGR